jgi:hypothetical protein
VTDGTVPVVNRKICVGWDSTAVQPVATGFMVQGLNPPSGLRRGSTADRLLGSRVRIPPGAWLFVLCVLYSKGQKAKPGQSGQRSTDKVQRENKKNPGGSEIFHIHSDRPWSLPCLLYNGYCVYFPGVKRPGRGVNHPHPSNSAAKGKVELYFYSSCGPSWTVLGRIVPFTFTLRLLVYMASFSFGEIR